MLGLFVCQLLSQCRRIREKPFGKPPFAREYSRRHLIIAEGRWQSIRPIGKQEKLNRAADEIYQSDSASSLVSLWFVRCRRDPAHVLGACVLGHKWARGE